MMLLTSADKLRGSERERENVGWGERSGRVAAGISWAHIRKAIPCCLIKGREINNEVGRHPKPRELSKDPLGQLVLLNALDIHGLGHPRRK